ncbi:MAG: hypothetical protein HFE99_08940 [Ruminiclostridium sp.]|jgi:hypothetical protein|nr:hypothetical protein [Ruminiclostridium sp.]
MKKIIALCLAMALSLALLAGCDSADPNNPYGQEPAPKVETDAEAE